ncbi:MAG: HAMP domain-containing protein [Actinobacteria bacterium]|nr:HAMP domain-containing protein [Actinomycetota bacterium]
MSEPISAVRSPRARRLASIQTQLLLILLLVSVAVTVVTGVLGYRNGTESLSHAAQERVVEVRDSRAREIERLYTTIENQLVVAAQGSGVIEAVTGFSAAFEELDATAADPVEAKLVADWYRDVWGPRLIEGMGERAGEVDAASFAPSGNAAVTLQARYTIGPGGFDEAIERDDAGDGSAWSAVHAGIHPYFRAMVEHFDYEDVLLIDPDGRVVYTAYKGADFGADLFEGPLRLTNLGETVREAMRKGIAGAVTFSDFADYAPSLGTPAGWAVTLIRDGERTIGALAAELPIERIEEVMTGNRDWADSGLGATGETYLVGPDRLMRSPARGLLEDPQSFTAAATSFGTPAEDVARMVQTGSTLLLQKVETEAVEQALAGHRGTVVGPGFLGRKTIAAHAPVTVEGLHWVIVAEVAQSEAFAPVDRFTSGILVSSAVIVLLVSVASLIIARLVVRPLRRLREAAHRIAAGETGVVVDIGVSDELADLAAGFNEMSRSLQVKAELLEAQREENQRLLRSVMPDRIAEVYRLGSGDVVQDHNEVTVLYADVVGFEDIAAELTSPQALAAFNEILTALDELAERLGLEHVRTTRSGYLAGCGVVVPRVDNARRAVDFALEAQAVLARFSVLHHRPLALRVGLDTGTVTSGLVGRSHVAYDLWGDAVSLAFRVQGDAAGPGVYATDRVVQRLPAGSYDLEEAGRVETASGDQRVWLVRRTESVVAS